MPNLLTTENSATPPEEMYSKPPEPMCELIAVPPGRTISDSPKPAEAPVTVPLPANTTRLDDSTITPVDTTSPPALIVPLARPPDSTTRNPPASTVAPLAMPPLETTRNAPLLTTVPLATPPTDTTSV